MRAMNFLQSFIMVSILLVPLMSQGEPTSVPTQNLANVDHVSPALVSVVSNCHIGRITGNIAFDTSVPSNYCLHDRLYMGAGARIGRINLFRRPPLGAEVRRGMGMVSADLRSNLFARLAPAGGCPKFQPKIYQFRDDWYADEGGYQNTTAERLKGAQYLEMTGEITPVQLLEYTPPKYKSRRSRAGDHEKTPPLIVTVRNPFKTALNGLVLVIHYEGGRHKPMPHYEEVSLNLQPGEEVQKTIAIHKPLSAGKAGETGWWRFASASLEGSAGGCTFWPTTFRR